MHNPWFDCLSLARESCYSLHCAIQFRNHAGQHFVHHRNCGCVKKRKRVARINGIHHVYYDVNEIVHQHIVWHFQIWMRVVNRVSLGRKRSRFPPPSPFITIGKRVVMAVVLLYSFNAAYIHQLRIRWLKNKPSNGRYLQTAIKESHDRTD